MQQVIDGVWPRSHIISQLLAFLLIAEPFNRRPEELQSLWYLIGFESCLSSVVIISPRPRPIRLIILIFKDILFVCLRSARIRDLCCSHSRIVRCLRRGWPALILEEATLRRSGDPRSKSSCCVCSIAACNFWLEYACAPSCGSSHWIYLGSNVIITWSWMTSSTLTFFLGTLWFLPLHNTRCIPIDNSLCGLNIVITGANCIVFDTRKT